MFVEGESGWQLFLRESESMVVFMETFKEGVPALLLFSPRGAGAFSVPSCGDCVVPGGGGGKLLLLAKCDPV